MADPNAGSFSDDGPRRGSSSRNTRSTPARGSRSRGGSSRTTRTTTRTTSRSVRGTRGAGGSGARSGRTGSRNARAASRSRSRSRGASSRRGSRSAAADDDSDDGAGAGSSRRRSKAQRIAEAEAALASGRTTANTLNARAELERLKAGKKRRLSLDSLDERVLRLEQGGVGPIMTTSRSFEDDVLRWLDADAATRMHMVQSRRHDYSRKWYRRTLGVASMLLLFTHLTYVITSLVVEKPFTYFHVLNWLGVIMFFLGGYSIWVHKTSWQVTPNTHHWMTQFYFLSLTAYLVVGILAWFINLFAVDGYISDYCADQPDGLCPTGTTEGGLKTFVVFGLLFWFVFFVYFFGALARYAFLYLATIERHYYMNAELRKDLRMSVFVALLGRNLCLLARTLNFLCCESCSPKNLMAKMEDEEGSESYTDAHMFDNHDTTVPSSRARSRDRALAALDSSYDEEEEEAAPRPVGIPRTPGSRQLASEHGTATTYYCSWFTCFLLAYVSLILCYTSDSSAMFGSVGCFVAVIYESYM